MAGDAIGTVNSNWFSVLNDKKDIGTAQTGGAYISEGSSKEF